MQCVRFIILEADNQEESTLRPCLYIFQLFLGTACQKKKIPRNKTVYELEYEEQFSKLIVNAYLCTIQNILSVLDIFNCHLKHYMKIN